MADGKLLVVHMGALGDIITVFPALIRLKENFPGLDMLCQGQLGRLAQDLKIVQNSFALESAKFAALYAEKIGTALEAFLRSYDQIILFSFSNHLRDTVKSVNHRVQLILPRPRPDAAVHVTLSVLDQLADCGLIAKEDPQAALSGAALEDTSGSIQPYHPKRILLHPGSGSARKLWPLDGFLIVAEILAANGLITEFLLGPAEHHMAEPLIRKLQPGQRVHRPTDLRELLWQLKTSGGLIGNDSGVSHLAAFVGLPTVAVFGPSDPQRWRPLGKAVKTLRANPDCPPCFETATQNCEPKSCLTLTSPERVVHEFYEIYPVCTRKSGSLGTGVRGGHERNPKGHGLFDS